MRHFLTALALVALVSGTTLAQTPPAPEPVTTYTAAGQSLTYTGDLKGGRCVSNPISLQVLLAPSGQ